MVLNRLNRTTFRHVVLNLLVILVLSLVLVGCKQVESIELDKTDVTLTVGDTTTVTATVKPDKVKDTAVTWETDKPDVATVNNGVIEAVKVGTAVITAKAGDKEAKVNVTVNAAQEFTVSFNGADIAAITVTKGAKATEPAAPTKDNATFVGWYKDAAFAQTFDWNAAINANTTVYVKWNYTKYTVTFNVNEGSEIAPVEVIKGDKVTKPADPTKTGYHFVDWYKEEALTTAYDFNDAVTAAVTLYAKWEINKYNVTFDEKGGSTVTDLKVTHGEKAVKPEDPTLKNYEFGGWYTDPEFENAFDWEANVTGNVQLYAKWTMLSTIAKMEFELNGGAWSASAAAGFITATPVSEFPVVAFKGNYYTYAGKGLNIIETKGHGVNAWAHEVCFSKNADGLYEVKKVFPASGSKVADYTPYEYILISHTDNPAANDFNLTLTEGEILVFEGLDFANQTEVDLTNVKVKVYAKGTKPDFTNSFFAVGSTLPAPAKYRKAFEGWYDNPEFTGEKITTVTTSAKLYAKWVAPFYAVSFDSNGGEPVAVQYVDYNKKPVAPAKPHKDGYVFAGWFADEDLTVPFDFNAPVTAEKVAYAKWDANIAAEVDYNAVWNEARGTWYIKVTVPNENLDQNTIASCKLTKEAGKFLKTPVTKEVNTDTVLWFAVAKENGDLGLQKAGEYAYEVVRKDENNSFYGFSFNYEPEKVKGVPEHIIAEVNYAAVYNPTRKTYYIEVTVPGEFLDAASVKSIQAIREAGVYLTTHKDLIPDTDTVLWFGVRDQYRLAYKEDGIYSYAVERADGSKFVFEFTFNNDAVEKVTPVEIQDTTIDYYAKFNADLEKWYVKVNTDEKMDMEHISAISLIRFNNQLIEPAVVLTPDSDPYLWFSVAGNDYDLGLKENGTYEYLVTRTDNTSYVLVLDYDKTLVKGLTFTVNYNLNGGTMLPVLTSKYAIINAFLTDFHTYLKAPESLSDFMHGAGKTTGYQGLWYSKTEYKNKLYAGYRPTVVDENYFISSAQYMKKWLPFFDFLDFFTYKVNPVQWYYDGTYVGLLRIDAYIRNTSTGAAYQPLYPTEYTYHTEYRAQETTIKLGVPYKSGYTFMGWYDNPEFSGEPVGLNITITVKEDKNYYAKWVEKKPLAQELFFSEYGEGSSNNKWVEIYNPSTAEVDLSQYKVVLYMNGKTTPENTIQLTGTLAAGETYVIYNSSAAQAIQDAGDLSSGVLDFNGNDAVVLVKNGEIIDGIGVIGNDPATDGFWIVDTAGDVRRGTMDYTLIRKPGCTANPRFYRFDWTVKAKDDFTNIGTHTFVV